MELIYERSVPGRRCCVLPRLDVPCRELPDALKRSVPARLPELSETDVSRHYTALARGAHGVNDGFYPLGSCTMKYNPKINERVAALEGFTQLHPLCGEKNAQGALEALWLMQSFICEITGMDAATLQPAAGAHGEYTGLLLIKKYHELRGDNKRTKIIVPDSAHGTNPASAAMAGFTVVNIPSNASARVDLDALRAAVGEDTAGLMLTNPNTVGLFESDITEIADIVHSAGGLLYYDGANLNAVMGVARPGDMGFDVVHLNLHKTFSTPHGGGGPGSGPVGCREKLRECLPAYVIKEGQGFRLSRGENSIGRVKAFYGNFAVVLKALCYILTLGPDGIKQTAESAVLAANYLCALLKDNFDVAFTDGVMHEFVLTLERQKKESGVSAMDIAKLLIDRGMHPPTMYFPLIVHEALMVEPTETESKQSLEAAAAEFKDVLKKALADPSAAHAAPVTAQVGRLDEVEAARHPILKYSFGE